VRWSLALWSPADRPDRHHGQIVVVPDAQDLTDAQQQQLLAWMERHPAVQVISVASRPLYPMVEDGSFRATLYYRLNTFYFAL
jgi:transcriptional regulator of acetoin/glycerol metabolism